MDKTDWTYILAIVILICTTILGLFGVLSTDDIVKIFLLIVGAALGIPIGIGIGYELGYKKGAAIV